MTPRDFASLENIEFEAGIDFYRAAPEDVRLEHAVEVRNIGPTTCLTCRGFEPAVVFRRAVRLGVGQPTTEAELESVLSYMNELGAEVCDTGRSAVAACGFAVMARKARILAGVMPG